MVNSGLLILASRMADKVTLDPSGCWRWAGANDGHGYGHLNVDGTTTKAHRIVYEQFCGPIPDGLEIDHLCHTADPLCPGGWGCVHRSCVNPDHLEPVTRHENIMRGRNPDAQRQRARRVTHCPQGHEYTAANTKFDSRGCRNCRACAREYASRPEVRIRSRDWKRRRRMKGAKK